MFFEVIELVGREAVLVSLYLLFGSPSCDLRLCPLLSIVMFLLELSSVRSRCSTFGFIIDLSIVKLQFGDVVPFLGLKPTGSSGFFGKRLWRFSSIALGD